MAADTSPDKVPVLAWPGPNRKESGPVQIGADDWPGYFLRGDDIHGIAQTLAWAARETGHPAVAALARGFAARAESCRINAPPPETAQVGPSGAIGG